MKQIIIAAITAATITSCAPKQNTLTEEEAAAGWQLLFDGKSLDGWRNYNAETLTGWSAEGGTIRADGSGSDEAGYIVTTREYENFHLSVDWRLTPGGNSGLLYHVVERPEYAVPYVTGPEYQLIDQPGWEKANAPTKLEPWQRLGVDYAMHTPDLSGVAINPPGRWNNSEIVFDNGHVEHRLNGVKILEFDAWTDDWFTRRDSGKWTDAPEYGLAHRGLVCLQDHGDPASFRNIKIKELPRRPGRTVTLFNGVDLTGWIAYGTETITVEEGAIVLESGPDAGYGYLATREYYDDFDCTFDFLQQADGNSGFFFRSVVFPPAIVNGWQVEIAPPGRWTGGIYESYGRGWLEPRPTTEHLLPGEWNTMRVRVEGGKVTVWLNGAEVTSLTDPSFTRRQGRLALQIHDGGGIRVLFRNFTLKTL